MNYFIRQNREWMGSTFLELDSRTKQGMLEDPADVEIDQCLMMFEAHRRFERGHEGDEIDHKEFYQTWQTAAEEDKKLEQEL